jgi:glycine/D-amino acid oxidase-like deaminating enzyme
MGDYAAELLTTPHANLWEETAPPPPPAPPRRGAARADVLVVGAGYAGLSAALHLAEAGVDVLVAEAHAPGWGASGRNGGQVIPGLKYDPVELEAVFGKEIGCRLWRFAAATADVVFDLIARHGLQAKAHRSCWVQGIHNKAAAGRARRRAAQWAERGADVAYLEAADAAQIAGTDRYVGAFVDRRAGALQPLSYARELARVAIAAGARVHGGARLVSLAREGTRWRARTADGATVEAAQVLVCTNAYADALVPCLAASIIAATSLQVATEPLPAPLRAAILPNGEVLSDTRRVIRYWRVDDAGRLLMGGRGPYREPEAPADWAHLVREVRLLFPQLGSVRFTHRWGGRVALHPDFLPRLHAPAPGCLVAVGCQGRGIGWQTAIGRELAALVHDPAHAPILPFAPIRRLPLPRLRPAWVTAATAMYRVLDRMGWA